MPRKQLVFSTAFPYHVAARINNKEEFPCTLEFAWKTLTSELYLQALVNKIQVHAFVLMPNHFHLLVSTPQVSISKTMQGLLSASTRIIHVKTRRSGHLFGGRYFWSLIQDPLYYAHALKYVYRNPVKAELCELVEDYKFSTFSGLVGKIPLPVAIHSTASGLDRLIPVSYDALSQWLNQPHRAEEAAAIQRGLTKRKFKPPVNRNNRRIFPLSEINAPPSPKGSDTKWWSHPESNGDQSFRKAPFYPFKLWNL